MLPAALRERACRVTLLVLDVDGVMTDGSLHFGPEGEALKTFHVHDGLGIQLLHLAEIRTAIISGKTSAALEHRLDALGIARRHLGRSDKLPVYHSMLRELGLQDESVAYVGDDLPDVPVMRRVGLPIAVANAHSSAKAVARWVTTRAGGRGAVREVAEALLEAKGVLAQAQARYLNDRGG